MSGYNDDDKLRDAIELARSFGIGKGQEPKSKQQAKYSSAPSRQSRHQAQTQNSRVQFPLPPRPSSTTPGQVPPPSQRNYASSSFMMPGARINVGKAPVIGSSGLDFLRRQDAPVMKPTSKPTAPANEINKPTAIPKVSSQMPSELEEGKNNVGAIDPSAANFSEASSKRDASGSTFKLAPRDISHMSASTQCLGRSSHEPTGNILDTFFSLVSQRPTIGQEIDAIADRLPDAMNLNAPGLRTPSISSWDGPLGSKNATCTCKGPSTSGTHENGCPLHNNSTDATNTSEFNNENSSFSNTQGLRPQAVNFSPNLDAEGYEKSYVSHPAAAPKASLQPPVNAKENVAISSERLFPGNSRSSTKPVKGLSASMWA